MVKISPKILPKVLITNPTVQKLQEIKNTKQIAALQGDFKAFKKASREFADLAINNIEETKRLKSFVTGSFSLFSATGFRLFKIMMRYKLSKKTPQEKILDSIIKLEKHDAKMRSRTAPYINRVI